MVGVIAMLANVVGFWKFVSHRAALILGTVLALGLVSYWMDPNQGSCSGKAWFCSLVKDRQPVAQASIPCVPEPPLDARTRIFQSEAANAEVHRQIQSGVCQHAAIARVAKGWKAPYDPAYAAGLRKDGL